MVKVNRVFLSFMLSTCNLEVLVFNEANETRLVLSCQACDERFVGHLLLGDMYEGVWFVC